MHFLARLLGCLALLAGLITATTLATSSSSPSVYSTARPCTPSQVRLSAPHRHGIVGLPLTITLTLTNTSPLSCTYSSVPVMRLTGHGHLIWSSCTTASSVPCTPSTSLLDAGSIVRLRRVVSLTGHPGRYQLTAHFARLGLVTAMITLHAPREVHLSLANNVTTLVLTPGDLVIVTLPTRGAYVWDPVISTNPAVATPVTAKKGYLFRVLAPGITTLSAIANPVCAPRCAKSSHLFSVDVTAR